MRARAKLLASCAGQLCGRCSWIIVFISTTRAATSASFSRSVSNWALRHRDPEAPHQPVGAFVQEVRPAARWVFHDLMWFSAWPRRQ